jgi:hypothetical protein
VTASALDGPAFDLHSAIKNGLPTSKVDVSRGEVVEGFVVAAMIVMLDEVGDGLFEVARSEKHFWCDFMDVISTSAGTDRKARSKLPMRTTGHSVRPAFSVSRLSSSISSKPWSDASLRASCRMMNTRSARSMSTFKAFSLYWKKERADDQFQSG